MSDLNSFKLLIVAADPSSRLFTFCGISNCNPYTENGNHKVNVFINTKKINKKSQFFKYIETQKKEIVSTIQSFQYPLFKVVHRIEDADFELRVSTTLVPVEGKPRNHKKSLRVRWHQTSKGFQLYADTRKLKGEGKETKFELLDVEIPKRMRKMENLSSAFGLNGFLMDCTCILFSKKFLEKTGS